MNTSKRISPNVDSATLKKQQVEFNDKISREVGNHNSFKLKEKQQESSRVGTSNSDLIIHRPSEQIKPVIKSMSDGYVPKAQTSKFSKLTLFNKDYNVENLAGARKKAVDDDEENAISFVKPKTKTTFIFNANKKRDQKSKLAMMLSFLRGDDSKDEVDCVKKHSNDVEKKPKEDPKEETKEITPPIPANLSTSTSVTFSTATTTSLLNVPSDATVKTIEPLKNSSNDLKETPKAVTIEPIPVIPSAALFAVPKTKSEQPQITSSSVIKLPSPTVTFNLPTTQATFVASTVETTSTNSTPRLGGFSFKATSAPTIPTLNAQPTIESILKVTETKPAATGFSFGLSKSTSNASLPTFTPPTFSAKISSNIETNSIAIGDTEKSSAPVAFNFGTPETAITTAQLNTPISFGMPSTSQVAITTNSFTASTPSLFGFGSAAKSTTSSTLSATNTITTSAPASTAFVFGASAPSAPSVPSTANTFGINTTTANNVLENKISTPNQTLGTFAFGSSTNTNKQPGSCVSV